MQAMIKLNSDRALDNETAYKVGRLCKVFEKEMREARKEIEVVYKKYVVFTPEGEPQKGEKDDEFVYNAPDGAKKCNEEVEALLNHHKFEVKCSKLKFSKLRNLCGGELVAIEDIVDELPDLT